MKQQARTDFITVFHGISWLNCASTLAIFIQFAVVVLTVGGEKESCPCHHFAAKPVLPDSTNPIICYYLNSSHVRSSLMSPIEENEWKYTVLQIPSISVELLHEKTCTALLIIQDTPKQRLNDRRICPGQCQPIPTLNVPSEILLAPRIIAEHRNFMITCSLSVDNVFRQQVKQHPGSENLDVDLFFLLKEAVRRVLLECNERAILPTEVVPNHVSKADTRRSKDLSAAPNAPDVTNESRVSSAAGSGAMSSARVVRRKLLSVVIWVGNADNVELIHQQSQVLHKVPFGGVDGVVAWAATDALYGCPEGSTTCPRGGNSRFQPFLPQSNIRYMPMGWNCAQRRPLRALSHVLMLFDPQFIVLLDDDTFFNYDLLMDKYSSFLLGEMRRRPLYMGEFQGRTGLEGHLSTEGMFVGGSGYILGHKVLSVLYRKEIHAFGFERWQNDQKRRDLWRKAIQSYTPTGATATTTADEPEKREAIAARMADSFRSSGQLLALSVLGEGMEAAKRHCASVPLAAALQAVRGALNQSHTLASAGPDRTISPASASASASASGVVADRSTTRQMGAVDDATLLKIEPYTAPHVSRVLTDKHRNASKSRSGDAGFALLDDSSDHNTCVLSAKPRPARLVREHKQQQHNVHFHHHKLQQHRYASSILLIQQQQELEQQHREQGQHGPTAGSAEEGQAATMGNTRIHSEGAIRTESEGEEKYEYQDASVVPIGVRLVDFCTNLMANEHTCQHR